MMPRVQVLVRRSFILINPNQFTRENWGENKEQGLWFCDLLLLSLVVCWKVDTELFCPWLWVETSFSSWWQSFAINSSCCWRTSFLILVKKENGQRKRTWRLVSSFVPCVCYTWKAGDYSSSHARVVLLLPSLDVGNNRVNGEIIAHSAHESSYCRVVDVGKYRRGLAHFVSRLSIALWYLYEFLGATSLSPSVWAIFRLFMELRCQKHLLWMTGCIK